MNLNRLLLCLFLAGSILRTNAGEIRSAPDSSNYESAVQAMRYGDTKKLAALLEDRRVLDLRDDQGTSLFLHAAFYLDAPALKLFLDKGADPNATNNAGASPLIWAAADPEKVALLLKHGANPNLRSARGNTALIVAAFQYGSVAILKKLLKAGAEVNARNDDGETALVAAAHTGDCEALRVLIEHKADVNYVSNGAGINMHGNALMHAAIYGHLDAVKLLAKNGTDIQTVSGQGNALSWAVLSDRRDVAEYLLDRGVAANVSGVRLHSFRSDTGYTPLMYAAMTERDNPGLVRALIARGAEVNARSSRGDSALGYARKRGNTKIVTALVEAGATEETPQSTPSLRSLWNQEQVSRADSAMHRKSIESALGVLLASGTNFIEASANRCFSCHQQTFPAVALHLARQNGFVYDKQVATDVLKDTLRPAVRRADAAREGPLPVPSIAAILLLGLHAADYKPDPITDSYAYSLARSQSPDGRWITSTSRAPTDYSDVTSTALSMRALQLYAPPVREQEYAGRINKAAAWLRGYRAESNEERAQQLLGLTWAGTSPSDLAKFSRALLKQQRPDGGWAQLDTLPSDAYATGQALFALHTSGGLSAKDPAYLRGTKFLFASQCDDGSWHVATRAFPVQKAMDEIFPHGNDQWISSTATTWAAMALMLGESTPALISKR